MAMAACSARPPRTAASSWSKRFGCGEDLDGAERPGVADDRGDDEVADAFALGQRVSQLVVPEGRVAVIPDDDDPALGDGFAGDALADPQVAQLDALTLRLADARIVGPLEGLALRIELVDDGAVGAEQPERLVDDVLEDVVGLAQGGDPRARSRAATSRPRRGARCRPATWRAAT